MRQRSVKSDGESYTQAKSVSGGGASKRRHVKYGVQAQGRRTVESLCWWGHGLIFKGMMEAISLCIKCEGPIYLTMCVCVCVSVCASVCLSATDFPADFLAFEGDSSLCAVDFRGVGRCVCLPFF